MLSADNVASSRCVCAVDRCGRCMGVQVPSLWDWLAQCPLRERWWAFVAATPDTPMFTNVHTHSDGIHQHVLCLRCFLHDSSLWGCSCDDEPKPENTANVTAKRSYYSRGHYFLGFALLWSHFSSLLRSRSVNPSPLPSSPPYCY